MNSQTSEAGMSHQKSIYHFLLIHTAAPRCSLMTQQLSQSSGLVPLTNPGPSPPPIAPIILCQQTATGRMKGREPSTPNKFIFWPRLSLDYIDYALYNYMKDDGGFKCDRLSIMVTCQHANVSANTNKSWGRAPTGRHD